MFLSPSCNQCNHFTLDFCFQNIPSFLSLASSSHKRSFLFYLHVFSPPIFHTLLIDKLNITYQPFFVLKNITKIFPIPCENIGLKGFKFLLYEVHYGPPWGDQFLPPLRNQILKVLMLQPKLLKSKWFAHSGV